MATMDRQADTRNTIEDHHFTPFMRKLTIFTAGGPFLDGFIMTIIGTALVQLAPQLHLDTFWTALAGASALLGLLLGGGIFGYITDIYGRQLMYEIDLAAIIVLSVAQMFVDAAWQLVLLRFLMGVAVGADYPIATSLLAEFSPRKHRAKMLGFLSCSFYAGAVVAGIAGYFLLDVGPNGWKWMLGLPAIPALILVFGRWGTPESPRWLLGRGREKEALEVIKKVYGEKAKLSDLEQAPGGQKIRYSKLFERGYLQRTFFVVSFWTLQIAPLYAIYTFGPQLLGVMGLGEGNSSIIGYTIITLMFFLGCIPPLWWINSYGRRPVIILGFVVMTVSMLILGMTENPSIAVIVICFGLYAFFSGGPNILEWIYPNELFPTEVRASAVGFGTAVTRISSAACTFGLPYALESLGIQAVMLICAGMSLLGVVICYAMAPETKGLSLAQASSVTVGKQETAEMS